MIRQASILCLFPTPPQTFLQYLRQGRSINHHGLVRHVQVESKKDAKNPQVGQAGKDSSSHGRVAPVKHQHQQARNQIPGVPPEFPQYRDEVITHPRVYRVVKNLTNKGMPTIFLLFIVVYFITGSVLKST